jgi:hypothetical protein
MYKVFEIDKSSMGAEARGFENNKHRWNSATKPIWSSTVESVLDNRLYKAKLLRIQRLLNTGIEKAYRTVSSEALRVITGSIHIHFRKQEPAKYHEVVKGYGHQFDRKWR